MKIQMKTIYAGPKGTYSAGQVIDTDREDMSTQEASELIAGGYAIEHRAEAPPAEKAKAESKADKEAEKKRGKQTR